MFHSIRIEMSATVEIAIVLQDTHTHFDSHKYSVNMKYKQQHATRNEYRLHLVFVFAFPHAPLKAILLRLVIASCMKSAKNMHEMGEFIDLQLLFKPKSAYFNIDFSVICMVFSDDFFYSSEYVY